MKLCEISEKFGGNLDGAGDVEIRGVAGLREAGSGEISFVANPKYAGLVEQTKASAVIVPQDWDREAPCALIRAENPDQMFAQVAEMFYVPLPKPSPGVHPSAVVADSVVLGEGVSIGANCVIDEKVEIGANTIVSAGCCIGHGSRIGQDCLLYPLVSMREFTEIGDRVIIHNGTVLGSDGFGYAVQQDGSRTKIPQIGRVVVGNDVEIGANVAIDRARFGKTIIGNGVKIDNLVQVAHNVVIGDHSVLCGQVGVSGSTVIGAYCILAGQAGVAGHLEISNGAIIGAKAGVMKNVPERDFVLGQPAVNHTAFKKSVANTMLLPKLKERIKQLEQRLAELEKATNS